MKNVVGGIGVIALFIVLFGAYFIFENNLEESAYELINKNLWLGFPLVLVGYIAFENIKKRFGKQIMDSNYFTEKMMESKEESKSERSWFFFHYLNGRCPYCNNNFLSEHISKKHLASDKVLRCSKCKSLCIKTLPDKWVFTPTYLAGGIVFLSELAGQHESKLMIGSVFFSLCLSWIISKIWINKEYIEG